MGPPLPDGRAKVSGARPGLERPEARLEPGAVVGADLDFLRRRELEIVQPVLRPVDDATSWEILSRLQLWF